HTHTHTHTHIRTHTHAYTHKARLSSVETQLHGWHTHMDTCKHTHTHTLASIFVVIHGSTEILALIRHLVGMLTESWHRHGSVCVENPVMGQVCVCVSITSRSVSACLFV